MNIVCELVLLDSLLELYKHHSNRSWFAYLAWPCAQLLRDLGTRTRTEKRARFSCECEFKGHAKLRARGAGAGDR